MKKFTFFALALLCSIQAIAQTPVAYYPFNSNANDAASTNL
jgi:uncharacterized membrane protein